MAAMRVFISYRRDDSMVTAALLYGEIKSRPEFTYAFMDIDDIGYGDDFVAAIDAALHDAAVVVVVIGPRWAEMLQARLRGDDWVRHEVATALRLRDAGARPGKTPLRVVPVLIGGAAPPSESALPADLAPLARLGMLRFDEHALKASVNTLLEALLEEGFEGQVRRLQEERRKLQEERLLLEGERKRRNRVRIASVAVAFALFFAAIGQLFDFIALDERVAVATMLLARIGAPEPPWSGQVVLVGIDEETERKIGRKFDPDWRAEHAVFIANAASAAARSVAFDIFLEQPANDRVNNALRDALAALGGTREKMPVVFGVQSASIDGSSIGQMLAPFVNLTHQGIGCISLEAGQALAIPLAILRSGAQAATDVASLPEPSASSPAEGAQRAAAPLPSLALAAYSGGGRIEPPDKSQNVSQSITVRLRGQRRSQTIKYYKARTLGGPQPGCEVLQPGDRVLRQLLDPYALPALRSAPQRIAYERVVAGDPTALALLKNRVVLVGTLLPGRDRQPLPWPADDRWGVELVFAQIDAMARDYAIQRIPPELEWALMTGAALLGAVCRHRLRDRPRAVRLAALGAIALAMVVAAVAWYRFGDQLVGVTYDLAALALGAWLANRISRRPSA